MSDSMHPDLAQARRMYTASNRGLADYLQLLGLSIGDLQGKAILDLGCGPKCRFVRELAAADPTARITALDAVFLDTAPPPILASNVQAVGGLFTALPFADSFFDLVLSSFAMPLYLEGDAAVARACAEVARVLRSGGQARLAPLQWHRRQTIDGEAMLTDVLYDDEPETFERLLANVGRAMTWTVDRTDHRELQPPYDWGMRMNKH